MNEWLSGYLEIQLLPVPPGMERKVWDFAQQATLPPVSSKQTHQSKACIIHTGAFKKQGHFILQLSGQIPCDIFMYTHTEYLPLNNQSMLDNESM